MSSAKTCPTCGGPIAADSPDGGCPRCMLGAALAGAPAPVPTAAEVEASLPGFEVLSVLGQGGMGVVFRARQKALDRVVALKVLPHAAAATPGFAERFAREAKALAKLQHPNIVAVHDFGESADERGGGLFWLVMEFVDGANLRQAMRAGQVAPKDALAIVPQICDALQYAHEHGVVHRDIKPENVLLDRTGRVKVADFGLAKIMESAAAGQSLTRADQVMGTPHYMAPEQVEHPADVDHRADIYSLGVVFYEMLTGELPLGRFPAPSVKSGIDARIDEIVLRTLEKERAARYQQVAQVKTDVGRATAAPEPNARLAPAARTSKLAVASAISMVTALVALHTIAVAHPVGDPDAVRSLAFWIVAVGAAWISSIVAWVRIRRSHGDLRGRGWAVVGTFAPVVYACVLAVLFLVFVRLDPPDTQQSVVPSDPATDDASSLVAEQQMKAIWTRAQELPQLPSIAEASDLYVELPKEVVGGTLVRARDGDFGLPLIDAARLPAPRSELSIGVVNTLPSSYLIAAAAGQHSVWFEMRRSPGVWHFEPSPVVVADWSAWSVVCPPDAPGFRLANARLELVQLLMRLRKVWPVRSPADVSSLCPSTDATTDRDLVSGADGSLGLPLTSEQALGGRLCDFDVASLALEPDGSHASVTLRHWKTKSEVRFRIVHQSWTPGDWRHVWCFARERVER